MRQIQDRLERHIQTVHSLGGLFDASDVVSRRDFSVFAQQEISRAEGVQALSWNPRVPRDSLPGIDGRDLLGRIKTDDRLRRIPVIGMSTSNAADDVDKCYDLHVNSYVRKPMDMNGFVNVVKAIDVF